MVGELLRKAREEAGEDLKEISKILKIRYDYLKAIEDGNFKYLPEEVYIKGYIREYAEFLHIDPATALAAYVRQTSPPKEERRPESHPQDTGGRKIIPAKYILIFLLFVNKATVIIL